MTPPHPLLRRLPALGLAAWVAGAVLLWVVGRRRLWSPGELVLAGGVWVLVLAVLAREPVRNLFGPVFWYEITRVGRRFTTFLFRFLYVLLVCGLLTLLYLSWWSRMSRGSDPTPQLYVGVMAVLLGLVCLGWWKGASRVLYVGMGIALFALGCVVWWQDSSRRADVLPAHAQSQFAADFYQVFSVVQFVVVLLLTPAYVAGAITDEKERKTIDYLFTTDLANREIVFGKLAARLATVILYVLAGLPVVAFLQLFGGIDPDLALAGTAATLVTAVGLAAVAIAVSAAVKRSREAMFAAYGLVVFYLFTSFLLAIIAQWLAGRGLTKFALFGATFDLADATDWYVAGNAVYVVPSTTRGGSVIDPTVIGGVLGRYAAFWGVVSALAVGWAVTRLRRVALTQSYGGAKTKKGVKQMTRARPAIGAQPLVWREVHVADKRAGCFGWLFRFTVGGLMAIIPVWWAWMVFAGGRGGWYGGQSFASQWEDYTKGMSAWVRIGTGVLSAIIFLGAAMRGASAVAGEKDRDTWTTLCTTPISVNEFLFAKWLGAIVSMRFALGVLAVILAIGMLIQAVWVFMLPIIVLYLLVFTSAFALAGVWCSISARKALVANVRAFFLALFMAGGFWLVLLMCCVLPLSFSGGGGSRTGELFIVPLGMTPPFVMGILPLGSLRGDTFGPGPFHPDVTALGPLAPLLGLGFWVAVNFVLLAAVRAGLEREMNRGTPDPFDRHPPPAAGPPDRAG